MCDNPNTYVPNQFENESNIYVHYDTTAAEIWEQLDGKVDIFIAGIGSGGTVAGVGKFLKEKNPNAIICAVEPKGVSALLGHPPGLHKIEGIGDGFIHEILDVNIIDEIIEINDVESQKDTLNPISKFWERATKYDASMDTIFGTVDDARMPLKYLANLFSNGDEELMKIT